MKLVRTIANGLFFLTRAAAIGYLAIGAYLLLILGLAAAGYENGLPILIEGDLFTIYFPFTHRPFFLGEYNAFYIVSTISALVLYGVFLWLLSSVFNAFRAGRLFISENIKRLTRFYRFNLLGPIICVIILLIAGKAVGDVIVIALLHCLAGIFVFFMSVIFKQGLVLQEEQDLTL